MGKNSRQRTSFAKTPSTTLAQSDQTPRFATRCMLLAADRGSRTARWRANQYRENRPVRDHDTPTHPLRRLPTSAARGRSGRLGPDRTAGPLLPQCAWNREQGGSYHLPPAAGAIAIAIAVAGPFFLWAPARGNSSWQKVSAASGRLSRSFQPPEQTGVKAGFASY